MRTAELATLTSTGHRSYASLFHKAHTLIWDIDRDIDWSEEVPENHSLVAEDSYWAHRSETFRNLDPDVRAFCVRSDTLNTLRLLSIGEQVAQVVCAKQTQLFDREDWRNHASAQAMDESRHHMVYEKFLAHCGGTDYTLTSGLERMFDLAMETDDVIELTLREQLILESVGFGLFSNMVKNSTSPLLKRIFQLVIRDESRHIAFGMHFVKRHIAELEPEQRIAFAREALEYVTMFNLTDDPRLLRYLKAANVTDYEDVRSRISEESQAYWTQRTMEIVSGQAEPEWDDGFVRLFLNLKYVGILTEETVEKLGQDFPDIVPYYHLVNRKSAPAISAESMAN